MKPFFPNTIIQILLLLFFSLFAGVPMIFLSTLYPKILPKDLMDMLTYIIIMVAFIFFVYIGNKNNKTPLSLNYSVKFNINIVLLILFVVSYQVAINIPIVSYLEHLFKAQLVISHEKRSVFQLIGIMVVAPVFEEIIFRGIILKGMLIKYKPLTAILVSAMIFALVHGKPIQIASAFGMGLFVSLIFYQTKSLALTTLTHFFFNATGSIMSEVRLASNPSSILSITSFYGYYSLLIFILFLMIFATCALALKKQILRLSIAQL